MPSWYVMFIVQNKLRYRIHLQQQKHVGVSYHQNMQGYAKMQT
jgi:hypothetical protein